MAGSGAYMPVPTPGGPGVGPPGAEAALRALLGDLAARKELRAHAVPLEGPPADPGGANAAEWVRGFTLDAPGRLVLPGLRLTGAQLFLRNLAGPDSEHTRLLVKWQTGAGKS